MGSSKRQAAAAAIQQRQCWGGCGRAPLLLPRCFRDPHLLLCRIPGAHSAAAAAASSG